MPLAEHLHPFRRADGDAAIVFVHGFGGQAAATWGDFPAHVAQSPAMAGWDIYGMGYGTSLMPDIRAIWSADAALAHVARLLRTTLCHGTLKQYGALALVAHSMGGLVVQRAVLDLDPADRARVRHVFLYGTPSGGLVKAWLVRVLKPQLRDMAPGSDFLTALRRDWGTAFDAGTPFALHVVAGENDEFVPPESSLRPFPERVCHAVPGNHTSMVKPPAADALAVQLLVDGCVGGAPAVHRWNAARVAVQLGRFQQAVDALWPARHELDQGALVQLALALEEVGRQQDAIALLEQGARDTDAMGTLAGRLKRRWLAGHRADDAARALALYEAALAQSVEAARWHQAYYHAVNAAFMHVAHRDDRAVARDLAARALEFCGRAEPSMWRAATEGEAHLLLGDDDAALAAYERALAWTPPPDYRQITSMYDQATEAATRLGNGALLERLEALFRGEQDVRREA